MRHCYFDVVDHPSSPDSVGTDVPSLSVSSREALDDASEMMKRAAPVPHRSFRSAAASSGSPGSRVCDFKPGLRT